MPNRVSPFVPALCAALLAACQQDPIDWNDAAERRALVPPTAASVSAVDPATVADSILRATMRGVMRVTDAPASTIPTSILDGLAPACRASIRVAAGRGAERVAVWWSVRLNDGAWLVASRSADGGATWERPIPVDTLDTSRSGCGRPAPAVAVDSTNGYVHVAYSLVAPEGTGVFYAHRMGPTVPFERPLVIIYGDHVTPTSVASDGDVVAIAYEDPNTGGRPYVSLALSRTAGHSWAERFAVSSDVESAERPAVALHGRDVAVGWMVRNATRANPAVDDSASANAGGVVVVRVGRVR